ncbi:ComEC/Rec2 family competence protein [Bifidobacterium samirii]|uniref:ComEC/Rec2 family competence protein n=1 Tax=Bifidobacterium samirii TaxID=2306974 RepID=UPI0013DE834B|nr:ComEC/Rec2 family competence protein [Bifidobacterium samirii]
MAGVLIAIAPVAITAILVILTVLPVHRIFAPPVARGMRITHGIMTVACAAALTIGVATLAVDLRQWADPAATAVRAGDTTVTVRVRIRTPAAVADTRDTDCQADVIIDAVAAPADVLGTTGMTERTGENTAVVSAADPAAADALVERASAMPARLYASGRDCAALADGATVRVRGVLTEARYGRQPLWLTAGSETAGGSSGIETIRAPCLHKRVIARMHDAFFAVADRLPDQGRILVPGLTLGMLGQDHVAADGTVSRIDGTYAQRVEDDFRRSGIMHLMAVSGGHFMLVAGLIRRLCARFLTPRRITAACVAGAYLLLAAGMYPSDSVRRALVMGLIGAGAHWLGRRSQSVSALSWTVLIVLAVDPTMARSYGFALSGAAVLGIVLLAGPIGAWLGMLLPAFLAAPLAMTVAAQSLTLPIQIIMSPELPLASIPANLLVSPFVDLATMAGLASLALSWISPVLGYPPARLAACGTRVMEAVASRLAAGEHATLPWVDGIAGAVLMLAAETALALLVVAGRRLARRLRTDVPGLPGQSFRPRIRDRIALWWERTADAFGTDWADPPGREAGP